MKHPAAAWTAYDQRGYEDGMVERCEAGNRCRGKTRFIVDRPGLVETGEAYLCERHVASHLRPGSTVIYASGSGPFEPRTWTPEQWCEEHE